MTVRQPWKLNIFFFEKDSLTSGSVKGFIFFLFEPQSLFSSKHLMFLGVLGHAAECAAVANLKF